MSSTPRAAPSAAGASAVASPQVSHALAALALALLLGLQPITTDLYLPALPMLTRAFSARMHTAQLTMSAVMLAFGFAQMFWGPVADRVGRRPVLLAGMALYCVASIGAALADSIESLVLWRALQGAAMAAAVVCARAILRDLYEPSQGAQVMALALSGLGLIALGAPLLGGFIAAELGWRGPLLAVAAAGLGIGLFVALRLPETLTVKNPNATRLRPLLANWWVIGRHPVFLAWALLVACAYGGLFMILAASSFVYMDVLGLSAASYGAAMGVGSLSYIAGTFVCRVWIKRYGMQGTVARGAFFTLTAGLSIAALAAAGVQTAWAVLLPQCIFAFGHGLHQPCGQAGVVGPFPQRAGAAAALAGLMLALVAFGISRWLGVALDGTTRPMAYGLAFWALMVCAMAWGPVRRMSR